MGRWGFLNDFDGMPKRPGDLARKVMVGGSEIRKAAAAAARVPPGLAHRALPMAGVAAAYRPNQDHGNDKHERDAQRARHAL